MDFTCKVHDCFQLSAHLSDLYDCLSVVFVVILVLLVFGAMFIETSYIFFLLICLFYVHMTSRAIVSAAKSRISICTCSFYVAKWIRFHWRVERKRTIFCILLVVHFVDGHTTKNEISDGEKVRKKVNQTKFCCVNPWRGCLLFRFGFFFSSVHSVSLVS